MEAFSAPIDEHNSTLQHQMWDLLLGGLYPSDLEGAVTKALEPSGDTQKVVLDLGCAPGIWPILIAEKFPHAKVYGLDYEPVPDFKSPAPSNYTFVQADIFTGLPDFQGKVDVLHTRCLLGHFPDIPVLMKTIASCLKPGGLLILSDADERVYNKEKQVLSPLQPASIASALKAASVNTNAPSSWAAGWKHTWWCLGGNHIRTKPIETILDDGNWIDVKYDSYLTPLAWAGDNIPKGEEIGRIMKYLQRRYIKSSKSDIQAESGLSDAELSEWIDKFTEEIDSGKLYFQWHMLSAYKK